MPNLCRYDVIKPCKNEAMRGSGYCHLKKHHPTPAEYEIAVAKLYDHFESTTLDPRGFEIIDVLGDGACMYRCMVQMLHNSRSPQIREKNALLLSIPSDTRGAAQKGCVLMDDETEEAAARKMQELLKTWLYDNRQEIVAQLGCTVEELVLSTHEDVTTIDDYRILYEIFAGEPDFLIVEEPDGTQKKVALPFRWGGAAEQYAFHRIFGMSLCVYEIVTCDSKSLKIHTCTTRTKNYRLKIIQMFEADDVETVNLILTEKKGGGPHYMAAYKVSSEPEPIIAV